MLLSAGQAPGQAAGSAHFARGQQSFAEGDYAAALAQFLDAREAGAEGPAVEYNIGVCQYRLGRLDAAEASFRRLAMRFPAMRELAEYNIGLTLMAQGRAAAARPYFESVEQSQDATLRNLAAAMLERASPARETTARGWTRYLDMSLGHDSNVALIEESVLPAGESSSSPFVEFLGFASGRAGSAERWRVDVSGYGVTYADASQYNQVAVSASGLRELGAGQWSVQIGPSVTSGALDGDGFERRLGAMLRLDRRLTPADTWRIRLEHDNVDSIDDRFDYISGTRRFADVTYTHSVEGRRLRLTVGAETNDRARASVSPDRKRVRLGYRFVPLPHWAMEAEFLYRRSDYDELAVSRAEKLKEVSFSARRDLRSEWQLSVVARAADNASTDPLFDYSRTRIAIGLDRSF